MTTIAVMDSKLQLYSDNLGLDFRDMYFVVLMCWIILLFLLCVQ